MTADEIDNSRFSGATVLDAVVDARENDRLKAPELLRRIDEFQSEMETLDSVGDTLSIAELIKRMNRVMNEDRAEAEVIPDSKDLVAQYLLLYSISGDPGDFDDLVDYVRQRQPDPVEHEGRGDPPHQGDRGDHAQQAVGRRKQLNRLPRLGPPPGSEGVMAVRFEAAIMLQ